MAGRGFWINGETMVSVNVGGGGLATLGLAEGPISVTPKFNHLDIKVDAYGYVPPNIQIMLGECIVSFSLVHFDRTVLESCLGAAMGGTDGVMPRAGTLMGMDLNGNGGNFFTSLNLSSPVGQRPWRFPYSYMADNPVEYPLGAERSVVMCRFRAIPYAADPATAAGQILWDHGVG